MLLLLYKRNSPFDHVTFCHRNVICVSDKSYACSHASLCTCSSFKVHREQDLFWNKGESITAPLDCVNSQFCAYFGSSKAYYINNMVTLVAFRKTQTLLTTYVLRVYVYIFT